MLFQMRRNVGFCFQVLYDFLEDEEQDLDVVVLYDLWLGFYMFMESFWVLFGIDNYKDMEIFVKEVKEWVIEF